ncbi:MAG TPA: S1-like domain-containing RNA-binding protein [Bacteroidales bacterium]|nr:S1-like domain-containing RNA-binding protein [Bacteroidales bacterium]
MVLIGNYNKLEIIKKVDHGVYLDGLELGEILLPARYVPEDAKINSFVDVFLYNDSEDRLIATTLKPYAQVGDFAYLKVASVHPEGAFLDWGLPKDLLVPFREQKITMTEGKSYIVAVFLDKATNRIAASSKIDKFLKKDVIELSDNQEVDIMVDHETDIGYTAIVNNAYHGLLYKSEIFQPLPKGMKCEAWIKKIREDKKIDLSLTEPGRNNIESLAAKILTELKNKHGFLPLNDKSPSENIYSTFQQSKKSFKTALGFLYKQRLIIIGDDGIHLVNDR